MCARRSGQLLTRSAIFRARPRHLSYPPPPRAQSRRGEVAVERVDDRLAERLLLAVFGLDLLVRRRADERVGPAVGLELGLDDLRVEEGLERVDERLLSRRQRHDLLRTLDPDQSAPYFSPLSSPPLSPPRLVGDEVPGAKKTFQTLSKAAIDLMLRVVADEKTTG